MADEKSLKTLTIVVYALQGLGFINGVTWIVAVIINYVKRDEVKGSWLESHFSWQIRTFWWGLLWGVIGALLIFVLVGFAVWFAAAVWIIYRIVKGWLYLNDGKPIS
jgi:Predicted membrane protein